jgi:hypothetical protein
MPMGSVLPRSTAGRFKTRVFNLGQAVESQ